MSRVKPVNALMIYFYAESMSLITRLSRIVPLLSFSSFSRGIGQALRARRFNASLSTLVTDGYQFENSIVSIVSSAFALVAMKSSRAFTASYLPEIAVSFMLLI